MRTVILSPEANDDLERLYDFALERELQSATPNFEVPERALAAIASALRALAFSPFMGRKVRSQFEREIVISFGRTGYVAYYKVTEAAVVVGAVRHQRESDYH